ALLETRQEHPCGSIAAIHGRSRSRARPYADAFPAMCPKQRPPTEPTAPRPRSHDDVREIALLLQPLAAVGRALLREQHVEDLIRIIGAVDRELHEPTRVGRHRRLAKLRGVHLAETFEARDGYLALLMLRLDAVEDQIPLRIVERI